MSTQFQSNPIQPPPDPHLNSNHPTSSDSLPSTTIEYHHTKNNNQLSAFGQPETNHQLEIDQRLSSSHQTEEEEPQPPQLQEDDQETETLISTSSIHDLNHSSSSSSTSSHHSHTQTHNQPHTKTTTTTNNNNNNNSALLSSTSNYHGHSSSSQHTHHPLSHLSDSNTSSLIPNINSDSGSHSLPSDHFLQPPRSATHLNSSQSTSNSTSPSSPPNPYPPLPSLPTTTHSQHSRSSNLDLGPQPPFSQISSQPTHISSGPSSDLNTPLTQSTRLPSTPSEPHSQSSSHHPSPALSQKASLSSLSRHAPLSNSFVQPSFEPQAAQAITPTARPSTPTPELSTPTLQSPRPKATPQSNSTRTTQPLPASAPSQRQAHKASSSHKASGPSSSSHQPNGTNSSNMAPRSRRQLGEYTLGKTLGAGSMGKVKLAVSSITGEKIAIKIIPRHTSMAAAQQQLEKEKKKEQAQGKEIESIVPSKSFIGKAKAKDISKEVRTIREASIVLLLHHPYVCGMKSMLVYPHHYYMLFEYVNGGQMLDYIISHGRLRERAARKFARQMGSALQYSHANSIVHRDLKIENILISKTGNIKIIDFGLSNLFSPNSHLQTFCGSLYFAAPELLNAKVYIGPEVDVWSFGIVLFVLVCGKVPFDDQSMPALHAKIKRGQVEYPTWLSSECKHILSRMLVTNPQNRANLSEVLSHPWMVKGFDGPPDPHIPHREPLRLSEIDSEVVKGMTGFEFGTAEKIEADLRAVLSSEIYTKLLTLHDAKRGIGVDGSNIYSINHNDSSGSMAANGVKKEHKGDRELPKANGKPSKRFSGFGFYGKKMAGGLAAVLNTVGGTKNDDKSSDGGSGLTSGLEAVMLNGQTLESLDPTRGFHPLISIYYLVREKIEREKIYGPGVFASSTLSLTGPPPPPAPPSAYTSAYSPAGPELTNVLLPPGDIGSHVPESRASVHKPHNSVTDRASTTAGAFDRVSPSPHSLIDDNHLNHSKNSARPTGRPSTAAGVLGSITTASAPSSPSRVNSITRDPKAPKSAQGFKRRSLHIMTTPDSSDRRRPLPTFEPEVTPKTQQRAGLGISGGAGGRAERVVSMIETSDLGMRDGSVQSEKGTPSGFARRFGSFLTRSSSLADPDYKRHRPRTSIGGSGHKAGTKTPLSALPQVTESASRVDNELREQQAQCSGVDPQSAPFTAPASAQSMGRASATTGGLEPPTPTRAQHQHHIRGSSTGATMMTESGSKEVGIPHSASAGSAWRPRLTSLNGATAIKRPTSQAGLATDANMLLESEEEEANPADPEQPLETGPPEQSLPKYQVAFSGRTASPSRSSDKIKPIYLKGLFSVATTSTRGPQVLRDDLVKVLNRIGVQHRDIKAGFECAHAPSIDLSSVGRAGSTNAGGEEEEMVVLSPMSPGSLLRRAGSMKKKASKTSFGKIPVPGSPAPAGNHSSPLSPETVLDEGNHTPPSTVRIPNPNQSTTTPSHEPQIRRIKKHDLIVRFEIFIVKMPLLPGIHGLQFRRISGNVWQYQTFARRILQELKL